MSWNRGESRETKPPASCGRVLFTKPKASLPLVVVAALIVGVLVVAGMRAARHGVPERSGQVGSSADAAERGGRTNPPPAAVSGGQTEASPSKPRKYRDMSNAERLKYYRDKYGGNIPPNLQSVVYYLENPPQENYKAPTQPYHIFKRCSEREIAALLLVEPGSWMMRPPEFGDKFDIDFAAAAVERIEFEESDTPEQRELRKAVADTKRELVERVKAGEKASAAMNAAARELYELGRYRRDLEREVGAVRRDPSASEQDVADIVTAANRLLEKKGLKPLKMPNMVIRRAALKHKALRTDAAKEK